MVRYYVLVGWTSGAHLSREPRLLSTLKATDYVKLGILALVVVGTIVSTLTGVNHLGAWILP